MSKQSLGLTLLETKNNPKQNETPNKKISCERIPPKESIQIKLMVERKMYNPNNQGCRRR